MPLTDAQQKYLCLTREMVRMRKLSEDLKSIDLCQQADGIAAKLDIVWNHEMTSIDRDSLLIEDLFEALRQGERDAKLATTTLRATGTMEN